ncbi:MAG: hypothetical protein WDN47_02370 [Candidatus Doudnabacteria bacterium]
MSKKYPQSRSENKSEMQRRLARLVVPQRLKEIEAREKHFASIRKTLKKEERLLKIEKAEVLKLARKSRSRRKR